MFCLTSKNFHWVGNCEKFYSENFEYWFSNKLLPNLTNTSLKGMDKGKCHKAHQKRSQSVKRMRKNQIVERLEQKMVPFDKNGTKTELSVLFRTRVRNNVSMGAEKLAEDSRHKVLWSLPCYSGLNVIEFSWAYLKARVRKKYKMHIFLRSWSLVSAIVWPNTTWTRKMSKNFNDRTSRHFAGTNNARNSTWTKARHRSDTTANTKLFQLK